MCVVEGQDPNDPQSDLDPDKECGFFERGFQAIAPCKDNCRGRGKSNQIISTDRNIIHSFLVDFPVVSGGAALVASTLITGTSTFSLPSTLALIIGTGAMMIGGNMVAKNMCLGKIRPNNY